MKYIGINLSSWIKAVKVTSALLSKKKFNKRHLDPLWFNWSWRTTNNGNREKKWQPEVWDIRKTESGHLQNGPLRTPFSPTTAMYMTSNDSLHPFTHSTHSKATVWEQRFWLAKCRSCSLPHGSNRVAEGGSSPPSSHTSHNFHQNYILFPYFPYFPPKLYTLGRWVISPNRKLRCFSKVYRNAEKSEITKIQYVQSSLLPRIHIYISFFQKCSNLTK